MVETTAKILAWPVVARTIPPETVAKATPPARRAELRQAVYRRHRLMAQAGAVVAWMPCRADYAPRWLLVAICAGAAAAVIAFRMGL